MNRVFGLDLLRCVAVLMVVAGHSRFLLRVHFPVMREWSVFGFLGVELFFVLSGFLIGGIALRTFEDAPTPATVGRFWIRRWFRTLPNYYLFLLLNFLVPQPVPAERAGTYFLFLQNLAWRCPTFFNESWSLAIEEWFYLLFPLLILAASRVRPDRRFAAAAALATLFLLSTGARLVAASEGAQWDADVRKVVVYRFDALMFGVLGALVKSTVPGAWSRLRLPGALAGAVLAAGVFAAYHGLDRNESFFARTFLFTMTSAMVLCFLPALDSWRSARGAVARGVTSISLWSYSLYLVHLPVMVVMIHAFGDPDDPRAGLSFSAALLMTAAFVAVSVALSGLNYRFFERPAMDLRDRFPSMQAWLARQPTTAAPPTGRTPD